MAYRKACRVAAYQYPDALPIKTIPSTPAEKVRHVA